jgi:hypothetical protein
MTGGLVWSGMSNLLPPVKFSGQADGLALSENYANA